MTPPRPGSPEWLAQIVEEPIEPERPIVDPHHHLWRDRGGRAYLLDDLWSDTESGHRIEKTVFVECRASYREDGPETLRPVGETEFVAGIAAASAERPERATIAGIVAHADLRLGDAVVEVLAAHEEAGGGLFRGIRHSGACDPHPEALSIPGRAPAGLYADADFRRGVAVLGAEGYTYDTWHYHHQNRDFAALARAVPDTTLILDHFGTPLGVGPYADRRDEIFEQWRADIAEIAACPNVVAKLGGLAMPDNGFGWNLRATPASSDELVTAQERYYLHAIDCFGPERCMFESNFPVDKLSVAYPVYWNAMKKLAAPFSADERDAMFRGTATRIYRLG
ncbi:MAG: amidohydrolase family protein [Thermoanaerobaculia bacterium]|nr:amidohydrolase family protein [Thermoanaerobaculia bacterium]